MSALDKLRSFAESRSADWEVIPGLTYADARDLLLELTRLQELIWNPHTDDFLDAVRLEAAHQRARWSTAHDAGKEPADWFWLLGWLSGKAVHAVIAGNREKALHHTISSAAVLLNWHAHLSGVRNDFQPGIDAPGEETP